LVKRVTGSIQHFRRKRNAAHPSVHGLLRLGGRSVYDILKLQEA
jgi:hypothetical protein